jgi:hypothetical protein
LENFLSASDLALNGSQAVLQITTDRISQVRKAGLPPLFND